MIKDLLAQARRWLFLWLVVVAVLVVGPLLPTWKYYRLRSVLTGSMSPTIWRGSLVVGRWVEPKNLQLGEIIIFEKVLDKKKIWLTHRIVHIEKKGELYFFKTKGDANLLEDEGLTSEIAIEGRVIKILPLLGFVLTATKSYFGFIFLILLPALLIIINEIKKIKQMGKIKVLMCTLFLLCYFFPRPVVASFSTQASIQGVEFKMANDWPSDDIIAPTSEILPPINYQNTPTFTLAYRASDEGSGLAKVEVEYRFSYTGEWQKVNEDAGKEIDNQIDFIAEEEGYYEFRSLAVDMAGNREEKFLADVSTVVDLSSPLSYLSLPGRSLVNNDLVYNGSFEDGLNGWSNKNATSSSEFFEDGALSAKIEIDGEVQQTLSLRNKDVSYLSFWYRLLTSDLQSGGYIEALINDKKLLHYGWDDPQVFGLDTGWSNVTASLEEYLGQTIDLSFRVHQSGSDYQTWAYLDEVKVCANLPQIRNDQPVTVVSSDASGSGVITSKADVSLASGLNSLEYGEVDLAGNFEEKKIATISAENGVDFGVVINKILPNPTNGNDRDPLPGGEWVELFNNSAYLVDINSWRLKDASGGVLVVDKFKTEDGTTLLLAKSSLRIYRNGDSDFTLNDDQEEVKLFQGETLRDSYSYRFDQALIGDQVLSRDPDGVGGWRLGTTIAGLQVSFYYQTERIVGFQVKGIETGYQTIEYLITYQSNQGDQGISGEIELNGESEITKGNFVLGSCSAGGSCTYYQGVKNLQLEVKLKGANEKVVWRYLN